jgi:hypothetical protein
MDVTFVLFFEQKVAVLQIGTIAGLCEKCFAAVGGERKFLDRHFDQFCEAKLVKMAIQKEYYLAAPAAK